MSSALIPMENITSPSSAADLKTVSRAAELEIEYKAVCREINQAADTGETRCVWQSGLDPANVEKLAAQGIKVEPVAKQAIPGRQLILSWV